MSPKMFGNRRTEEKATSPGTEVDDRLVVAEVIARALRREAHVLAERPEILWQQMYNRLQWEGKEVEVRLAPERARRSRPQAALWMRLATRSRESEALVRTLTGHTGQVS